MPRTELTVTSLIIPISQTTYRLYIPGTAMIQYIIIKMIHSGELEPRGNVEIVSITDKSVERIITRGLFIFFLNRWLIIPD